MALFNAEDLQAWRYCVQSCIFLINGEANTLDPLCITGMEIHNNYMKDTFPIFKVNFLLTDDIYYKVMANKTSLKIKLRIQKYAKKYNKSGENKTVKKDYINDTFVIIDDDNDVNRDADFDLLERHKNIVSDSEMDMFNNQLELYLYREETDTGVKKQVNNIFKNVTMSSVIGYLFGESGIKNALVSPLENNKTYKELLLPPLTINRMLAHMDAAYGFYKSGSVIFFGIDRTYILNFKGGCTAFERGERKEVCIYIPKGLSEQSASGGTVEKDDIKHYINWKYNQVQFKNNSVTTDVLSGSDALVVKPTTGGKSSSNSKVVANKSANTAIINDESDNPWLSTTFTAQTSSNATIVYGAMNDVDLTALTPNKKFTLVFEDANITSKYKGTYFLSSNLVKFINDSATGDFSVVAAVEFRRLQQTSSNDSSI